MHEPAAMGSRSQVDEWFYEPQWQVEPLRRLEKSCGDFAAPEVLKQCLATSLMTIQQNPEITAYWDFIGILETASAGYVVEALEVLGWNWSEGHSQNLEKFIQTSGIQEKRRRLIRRMFQILEEDGILHRTHDSWQVASAEKVNRALNARAMAIPDHWAGSPEVQLLKRCGSQLPSVLRGQCEPLSLLFPGNGAISATHLYGESIGAHVMNSLVRDAIRRGC